MNKLFRQGTDRKFILRILISGVLMIWLLSQVDLSQVAAHWGKVNWLLVALLVPIFYLFNISIRAYRLWLILGARDLQFSFWWLWLVQLEGSFFVSFLPGGLSGDIYRTYAIARKTERALDSVSSVLLEKVIGLAAMMFISVVSLLVGRNWLETTTFAAISPAVFAVTGVFFTILLLVAFVIRNDLLRRWHLPIPFWDRLQQVTSQLSARVYDRRVLTTLALLSLFLQLSIVLWYFTVATALGLGLSLLALLIVVPLVELFLVIPVSVGGIGLRDGALIILLLPFGLSREDAVAFSLLMAATATALRALSGIAFLFQSRRPSLLHTHAEQVDG